MQSQIKDRQQAGDGREGSAAGMPCSLNNSLLRVPYVRTYVPVSCVPALTLVLIFTVLTSFRLNCWLEYRQRA